MHTIPTQTMYFHTGNSLKIAITTYICIVGSTQNRCFNMTPVQPVVKNIRIWKVPGWRRASRWSPPWRAWCCFSCSMPSSAPGVIESLAPFFQGWPMFCRCQKVGCAVFWWRVHKGGGSKIPTGLQQRDICFSLTEPTLPSASNVATDDHFHAIENMLLQWVSSYSLEEAKIQNKKVERDRKSVV